MHRVEIPTEKRVKRWALSMEELMSDPTGKLFLFRYIRYMIKFLSLFEIFLSLHVSIVLK